MLRKNSEFVVSYVCFCLCVLYASGGLGIAVDVGLSQKLRDQWSAYLHMAKCVVF